MKKLVALILSLVMVLSLAACGETTKPTDAPKTTDAPKATDAAKETDAPKETEAQPVEMTEITFNCTDGTAMKDFWREKIEEFNNTTGKEKGITIVMTEYDQAGYEAGLENGTAPDIINVPNVAGYAEKGYLIALSDYAEFDEMLAKNNLQVETVDGKSGSSWQGKVYRIGIGSQLFGLAYNKDMFVAAGLVDENGEAKPPKTLEELREYAKILTNEANKQFGIVYPGKWSSWFGSEIERLVFDATGRGSYDWTTGQYDYSNYAPVLETILGMDDDGSVYPGVDGLDNDPARARFAEGNIGMKLCVSWDVGVWNEQFPAKFDWGVAKMPSASEDETYLTTINYTYFRGINAQSVEEKGIEKIAIVYNYLVSDEIQRELYVRGLQLPIRADIIETAGEINDGLVGWDDFGALLEIAVALPTSHPTDTAGQVSAKDSFLTEVWSRQTSIEDWVAERNAIMNQGMVDYKAANPDVDYSRFAADPDFDRTID